MPHATALLLMCLGPIPRADPPVRFDRLDGRLLIQVDGKPFAAYVWDDPAIKRPYLAHLRSPNGHPVTRNLPPVEGKDATDHATMHPGVWMAFGDLGGADFWRNKGIVRQNGFVEEPAADPQGGSFVVRNLYEAEGRIICEEVRCIRITITPDGPLIDWQSTFSSPDDFSFGDQEEMGLGARLATDLIVPNGGAITNSEGQTNEKQAWGQPADWCDFSGPNGGILLMPDPRNFRRSWFHVRDYGLMVANPFGRQALAKGEPSRLVVKAGESMFLRFGILIHDGHADHEASFRRFLDPYDHDESPR